MKKLKELENTLTIAKQNVQEAIKQGKEYKPEEIFTTGIESLFPNNNIDNKTFDEIFETVREKALNGGIIPFYFDQYDEKFLNGGFREGQLGITAANTGVGKSTFGTNVFYRQIINGKKVFYLSLEESKEEILERMLVIHANYQEKFQKYKITKSEWSDMGARSGRQDLIYEIKEDLKKYKIDKYIIDMSADRKYKSVMTQLMNLSIRRRQGEDIDMVHIDHIHNLKKKGPGGKVEKTGEIADGMMSFAKQSGIVIHLLAQLNKPKDGEKPSKELIRWSSDFAQDGYIVNLLYRKDYGLTKEEREEQGLMNEKTIEIIVDKNRIAGEMGSLELYIDWKHDYMSTIGSEEEDLLDKALLESVKDYSKKRKKIEEEGTQVVSMKEIEELREKENGKFESIKKEIENKEEDEEEFSISLDDLQAEFG